MKILITLTALLGSLSVVAQDGYISTGSRVVGVNTPHIRVVGEASVTALPNRAKIVISVVNEAPTERAAASLAAQQLSRVVSAVRNAASSDTQISTRDYSIAPVFEDAPINTSVNEIERVRNPRVASYRTTNNVEIRLRNVAQAQAVVDSASRAGAESVESIEYSLENDQTARALALKQAAANARANAVNITNSMDMMLDGVQNIQESTRDVTPPFESVVLRGTKRTSVGRGSVEVHATVSIDYGIQPRW